MEYKSTMLSIGRRGKLHDNKFGGNADAITVQTNDYLQHESIFKL